MYETILVGFDASPSSRAALVEAAYWVKRHGGKLVAVHAVFFDTEEFGIAPEQLEKRMEVGRRLCTESKDMITAEFGIEAQYLLCEGEPPEVIADVAGGKKADLIVLGTHGRRGLNRLLMGSVTSQVIVASPVEVLVVKRPCEECTGQYKSILVPFDGSPCSERALSRASQLTRQEEASMTVLYAIPRYEEMIDFFKTEAIRASMFREAQKIADRAISLASDQGVAAEKGIVEGPAADAIVDAAVRLKKDLIVMGSHGYRGVDKAILGSTAERVILNAPTPVLVVR